MFREFLDYCREAVDEPPRSFSLWDRLTYWRIVRPDWLYTHYQDQLETLFLSLRSLKKNGIVVWGHLIQANNLLFSPGGGDCPAEVVYSLENKWMNPEELSVIAGEVASLKHTQPDDPELREIANHLTNEMDRAYGKPVPKSISPNDACLLSTIYVVRKHLPKPRQSLNLPFMPILVNPTPPYVAIVLPSRYWPAEFVKWWNQS